MPTSTATRKSLSVSFQKGTSSRTFNAIISTSAVDRDKDVIDPKGWRLESYRKNPIILWQHRRDLPPIARCTDIRVSGSRLIAKMEFPPAGTYQLADEIFNLVDAGFLHSTSVGFLPIRSIYNNERGGHDILEAELLEFSIVAVPANSEALIQRCLGAGCDTAAVDRWLKSVGGCGCSNTNPLDGLLILDDEVLFDDELAHLTRQAVKASIREVVRTEAALAVRREQDCQRGRLIDY